MSYLSRTRIEQIDADILDKNIENRFNDNGNDNVELKGERVNWLKVKGVIFVAGKKNGGLVRSPFFI